MQVADRKGSLLVGKDADIVIFDEKINVKTTIVNGQVIYTAADFVLNS
jgi:N-acetylglucosamine-6-phosphate deacetylase